MGLFVGGGVVVGGGCGVGREADLGINSNARHAPCLLNIFPELRIWASSAFFIIEIKSFAGGFTY